MNGFINNFTRIPYAKLEDDIEKRNVAYGKFEGTLTGSNTQDLEYTAIGGKFVAESDSTKVKNVKVMSYTEARRVSLGTVYSNTGEDNTSERFVDWSGDG